MFYVGLLCCAVLSKFIQCLTDYGLRGIEVNFMRHLASLHLVSGCPPLRSGTAMLGLAISVAPPLLYTIYDFAALGDCAPRMNGLWNESMNEFALMTFERGRHFTSHRPP